MEVDVRVGPGGGPSCHCACMDEVAKEDDNAVLVCGDGFHGQDYRRRQLQGLQGLLFELGV
eukprot:3305574-Rhodomonas_salina.1